MQEVLSLLLRADSIWSVILRGALWLVFAVVIIVATDNPNFDSSVKNLKASLGFFLFFIILSGTLIFLLFGYAPRG